MPDWEWTCARRGALWVSVVVALLAAGPGPCHAQAEAEEIGRTVDSAVYLLRRSVTVQRDGGHNRLLNALRHLRAPALAPLFDRLTEAESSSLRIHGYLGQAEVRQPEPRLQLADLGEIEQPALQVQLISTALDNDLLHLDDAAQLLAWDDLEIGVKLLIALRLLEAQQFDDVALLREALTARRIGSRAVAAMMLHQLGEQAGTEALHALDRSDDDQRDAARRMIARAALRHDLHRMGAWGYAVTTESDELDPELRRLALRVALRFGDPRAVELWQARFEGSENATDRYRLALLAMEVAPWVEASLFEAMGRATDDALLDQVARTGGAIAKGASDVPEQVVELVRMGHPLMNAWAVGYARDHAEPTDAQLMLMGIVLSLPDAPPERRLEGLRTATRATQVLFEQSAEPAVKLLRPVLADETSDPLLVRAVLLGLMRAREAGGHRVLPEARVFSDSEDRSLALLLRARNEAALSARQMRTLWLLVRGGGGLQDTLRVQAAWCWLELANQTDAALGRVMDHVQ